MQLMWMKWLNFIDISVTHSNNSVVKPGHYIVLAKAGKVEIMNVVVVDGAEVIKVSFMAKLKNSVYLLKRLVLCLLHRVLKFQRCLLKQELT